MLDVIVVGAGGFGRETIDVVEAQNRASKQPMHALRGVVDDRPSEENLALLAARGVPYLGTLDEALLKLPVGCRFLVGVGDPAARRHIYERCRRMNLVPGTAIHPDSVIGSNFRAGEGTVICAGVQISTNVILGSNVHINPGAILGHDSHLHDFVSVNPGAIVSGRVQVERGALLGAGSIVLQGLTVGAGALVGAGAVVVTDVTPDVIVKGVPAR